MIDNKEDREEYKAYKKLSYEWSYGNSDRILDETTYKRCNRFVFIFKSYREIYMHKL